MEKDPSLEAQIGNESLEDRKKKSGFFERWQKKQEDEAAQTVENKEGQADEKAEPEPTFTEKIADFVFDTFNKEPETTKGETIDAGELGQTVEVDEVQEETDLEALQGVTKKVGNKVLRFATGVLGDTQKGGAEVPAAAVEELAESTQHLQEELDDLQEVSSDTWAENVSKPEAHPKERVEESEKKVPAFAGALMATLAIAGAGIFMVAVEAEHRQEHRILKKHRKQVAKFMIKHKKELEQNKQQVREQQAALDLQSSELQQLKADKDQAANVKERAAYVHQVSQLTEHQAEITHEVVRKSQEHQATREVGMTEVIVGGEHRYSPETDGVGLRKSNSVSPGTAAEENSNSPSSQNNATMLQKLFGDPDDLKKTKSQKVQPAWIFVAVFTTLVIAASLWLVAQLVING